MTMKLQARLWGTILLAAAALTAGCNSDSTPVTTSGSGGSAAGGSTPSSGGVLSTGGISSLGGATLTGGTPGSGGKATVTGGSNGGSNGTGGVYASGGASTAPTSGGRTATTGGETMAGGTSAAGGSSASGGSAATGGSGSGGASGGNRDGGPDGAADVGADVGADVSADVAAGDGPGKDTIPVGDVDPSKKITVWMSGDSTMAGDTIDTTACAACPCGWGAQFSTVFNSNVSVIDRAVAGRTIETWLYEKNVSATTMANGECTLTATTYSANWTAMLDANTGMKPGDYLLISFGINDGGACPRHVGTALFETYLETMAKAASDRGAQAIFLTPTNAIECTGAAAVTNTRGAYVDATKAAGTTANVPVVDLTTLSAQLYTSAGLCPNNGNYTTGVVGAFFCNDHTHFEKAGALQIVATVAKALRDQGIGLAAYLK
jgi:lysophospholipase L1-like esterase